MVARGTLRIVGIDPGSRATGFGVVDVRGTRIDYVASGCVRTADGTHVARLEQIYRALRELFETHRPDELVLERVFVHRNADSAIKLGQARSAALCGAWGVLGSDCVFEYTPRAVKQAVTGYGAAEKGQIRHMVKRLLNVSGSLNEDAADALAVALCHAHSRGSRTLRAAAGARR